MDPDRLAFQRNLASCYATLDRHEESLRIRQSILDCQRAILGDTHPDTLLSQCSLGALFVDLDRLDDAERLLRDSIGMMQVHLVSRHSARASGMLNLASVLMRTDRACEAEPLIREAEASLADTVGLSSAERLQAVSLLAECLARLGRPAEGLVLAEHTMRDMRAFGEDSPLVAQHLLSRAAYRFALRQMPEAEADAQHARLIMLAAYVEDSNMIRHTDRAIADARALASSTTAR